MIVLTPKNWKSFQHYKDRSPTWIKLHKSLLQDYEFHCLPVASKALAPMLWLLASEYEDGEIRGSLDALAFKLHMSRGDFAEALNPLLEKGFFDASEPLEERKQDASPEKETEEETEREKDSVASATGAVAPLDPSEPEREYFRRGKQLLGKSSGGQLANLLKVCGGNVSLARSKLELAATKQSPAEFVAGIIRAGPVSTAKPMSQHQRERETGREILNALRDASSRANSEFLRHDSSDGPESLRGGVRGALIDLSAASDRTGHEPVARIGNVGQLSQPSKVPRAS